MRWALVAWLSLAAACKRDTVTVALEAPLNLPPQVDVEAAEVTLAAVGDISDHLLAGQVETAALVVDAGYDAVLLLGDNQYPRGGLADYLAYFEPTWGPLRDRIYPVPGNHEYLTLNAEGYFQYFGERAGDPKLGYYSYDLGAWHVVALNTNLGCRMVACDATSAQVKWLREDLTAHRNRCTLAYFHHPRMSSGISHGDFLGADAIWQTLQLYGADVVLNGHEHFYERFEPVKGLTEFIVGTGGVQLYEFRPVPNEHSAVREAGVHGVLAMTLKPGGYDWRFVATPGSKTFSDEGSAECH